MAFQLWKISQKLTVGPNIWCSLWKKSRWDGKTDFPITIHFPDTYCLSSTLWTINTQKFLFILLHDHSRIHGTGNSSHPRICLRCLSDLPGQNQWSFFIGCPRFPYVWSRLSLPEEEEDDDDDFNRRPRQRKKKSHKLDLCHRKPPLAPNDLDSLAPLPIYMKGLKLIQKEYSKTSCRK